MPSAIANVRAVDKSQETGETLADRIDLRPMIFRDWRLVSILFLLLLLSGVANISPAQAQQETASKEKRKVIRFDDLTIAGEPKKPQVYYLLNRKKIRIGHEPIEFDFIAPLQETLEEEPL